MKLNLKSTLHTELGQIIKKKFIWRFFPTEGTRVKLNLKSTLHTELGQIIKNLYGTIKDPESPKQS